MVGAKPVTDDRGQTARPRGMGSLIGFKPNSFSTSTLECSFASQTGSKRAYRSQSNPSKEIRLAGLVLHSLELARFSFHSNPRTE